MLGSLPPLVRREPRGSDHPDLSLPHQGLLLAELSGRKPNKRMKELLHWHQLGYVDDDELAKLLAAEETVRQRRAAAKNPI